MVDLGREEKPLGMLMEQHSGSREPAKGLEALKLIRKSRASLGDCPMLYYFALKND